MTVQQDIEKLKDIQKAGIKSITIDGQTITYNTASELAQIISGLGRQVAPKKNRVFNPVFCQDGIKKC